MLTLLPATGFKKMLWKNKQGYTYEVARGLVSDRDKSSIMDDFDWRISMAEVKTSGVFSFFAGKQRILSVITGDGLGLQIDNQPDTILHCRDVVKFDGASTVNARLLGGTIRDLNVIYAPPIQAQLYWVTALAQLKVTHDTYLTFILNLANNLTIKVNQTEASLGQYDVVRIDDTLPSKIVLPKHALNQCCVIKITI